MSNLEGTFLGESGPDSYIMAPDFSVTVTQADAVKALDSLYRVHRDEWAELDPLNRTLTTAAALAVAMGHDADWALRMLANPYFLTLARVLGEEFTTLFEAGLLP